jgi:hypothetical protein
MTDQGNERGRTAYAELADLATWDADDGSEVVVITRREWEDVLGRWTSQST